MGSSVLSMIAFMALFSGAPISQVRAHPVGFPNSFGTGLSPPTTTPPPPPPSLGNQLPVIPTPAPVPVALPPPRSDAFSTIGATPSANGPLVAVGSGAQTTVESITGIKQASATSHLQGGGGFGFGTSTVQSTSAGAGGLPVTSHSTSTLVSTGPAALGTSQSGTIGTQASNVTGVPSVVTAGQGQASVISTDTGFTAGFQHSGTVSAGGTSGPQTTSTTGSAVQQQTQAALQQGQNIQGSASTFPTVSPSSVAGSAAQTQATIPGKY